MGLCEVPTTDFFWSYLAAKLACEVGSVLAAVMALVILAALTRR